MSFTSAISVCFSKYFTFSGRAQRSEYWYFYLFIVIISIVTTVIDSMMGVTMGEVGPVNTIAQLLILIPMFAAGCRRLHDIGKSGWWWLIMLTGIGVFVLIYWWCKEGNQEANQYGN